MALTLTLRPSLVVAEMAIQEASTWPISMAAPRDLDLTKAALPNNAISTAVPEATKESTSGGSDEGSNHYGSENGSNAEGDPSGMDDSPSNHESSSDGTGSDNGGETTSDASFANPSSNAILGRKSLGSQSGAPTEKSLNQQQLLYRQLAREAQMNALEQKEGRSTSPGGSSRSGSSDGSRRRT
jgi:hypothetical protein